MKRTSNTEKQGKLQRAHSERRSQDWVRDRDEHANKGEHSDAIKGKDNGWCAAIGDYRATDKK